MGISSFVIRILSPANCDPGSLLDECVPYVPSMWLSHCEPHDQKNRPPTEASWRHDHRALADLADYEWLTGLDAARWLEDLASASEPVHQRLSRLRKSLTAARARLVAQQVELRHRAAGKFAELANQMFFCDVALQQATDLTTARYKASRVPHGQPVVDFCCGIGGDLLAFAERGPTTGWDRAPELVHLAAANLQAAKLDSMSQVCVGDVEMQTPDTGEIWHLDPDRRADGRRSTLIQWHSPGPQLVDRWLTTHPEGILKLAPATVAPVAWSKQAELEWVTCNRHCRQQVAWFGELAAACGQRRATVLHENPGHGDAPLSASFAGSPDTRAPIADRLCRYIFDTDPAVRAASLVGALAVDQSLLALTYGASYLTSDHGVDHPLLARFEVLDQLPLRVAPLSRHLRSRNIGRLEIKKRGIDATPERLRKQLKLCGDESATLLLMRLGRNEIALLAQRCS